MRERKILKFNKYIFAFLIVWFICGVGITFAYYAYSYQNDSAIIGSAVGVNGELKVELVVGSNEQMVPLSTDALSNALIGKDSDNGPCVDSDGNLSCQVYKITLINYGSRVRHVNGTIELFAKEGTGNAYSNLKWIELEDQDTIKSGSFVNPMTKSMLISNLTIESKAVGIWYIAVWIEETDGNQVNSDKGEFGGIVRFESDLLVGDGLVENILERNAENDVYLDFSKTSAESGTNGVYVKNDTTDDSYPIYYWRGSVNNNLIFAGHCWKMVRTTKTGGLKILYSGLPTADGQCKNTGNAASIGLRKYSNKLNSLAYTGYMYSNDYVSVGKTMSSITAEYKYGNDVVYNNGQYSLVDDPNNDTDVIAAKWNNVYNDGLVNNHYTCFSTETTCTDGKVYYIYYTTSGKAWHITLTNGKKVEDAIREMLGADDKDIDTYNTISSYIKGDKDTAGSIDNWYFLNIEEKGYSSYLEDTVWCNDRRIFNKAGWDPNGGKTFSVYLTFEALNRQYTTHAPVLECARKVDSFTVNDKVNGNGKLTYPVGLLTPDEIMLAGGKGGVENDDYYLYSEGNYWSSAPNNFYSNKIVQIYINTQGLLNGSHIDSNTIGVRPVISLKNGYTFSDDGNGSSSSPFVMIAPPILEEEE